MPRPLPTRRYLKAILNYDPQTGLWKWRKRMSGRATVDQIAGSYGEDKRHFIRIDGVLYLSHRLAFVYMLGREPYDQVDHANRKKDKNNWHNLRDATNSQNSINKKPRSDSTSGCTGVYAYPRNRYRAKIVVDGKQIYLGIFKSKKAARTAYRKAALQYFGEFARQ